MKQRQAIHNEGLLERGLQAITHRGPDYQAFWKSADNTTALGHTRLSIIDLNSGNQPIVNLKHKISIVVNGEFYGYKQIRAELEALGHTLQTETDSEILIFLYLEYGLDFVEHLRGEFAFVLYDEDRDMLIAGRDRFGIKPLCYYQDADRLCIASEAKALLELDIPKGWDEYGLMHAANMQYQPTDRTLFKNIRQLPPGHLMVYKNHQLSIQQYWDLNYREEDQLQLKISEAEAIAQFRQHLSESVNLRLVSDVPVCFHLSGGLDSSSVVALANMAEGQKKHCFTVSFEGSEHYDETRLAKDTAHLTGSELHLVNVGPDDLLTHLEDAVYYSEGLAINGHITGKYLLNRAIRQAGFKVALTGEGSDEVLAGYPHLKEDLLATRPNQTGDVSLKSLYDTNLVSIGVQLAQGEGLNVSAIERQLGFVPSFLRAKASLGLKLHTLLTDDFAAQYQQIDFYDDMLGRYDVAHQLKNRHPVNQSLYLWSKLTLVNYILNTLGDGCEMSHAIEGRLPFLDHHLFEFVRNLPMEMKIRNGTEKYILREALKADITPEMYTRQKHPFMAPPVTRLMTPRNTAFIMDTLQSSDFQALKFFDTGKVQQMLARLPQMDIVELTAHEPVIFFLLTATFIQKRYGL